MVHLPPGFVLGTLSPCSWQRRVAQSIPNASGVARGCWCQGVCSIRAVQSPPARHRARGIRRLLQGLWGFAGGGGEMGLFQGGVVRAGFMKRAVCFYPDSQRRCLQSREENLCPWSTQGTSTARGFFSCWLTLTFYCTWPFC